MRSFSIATRNEPQPSRVKTSIRPTVWSSVKLSTVNSSAQICLAVRLYEMPHFFAWLTSCFAFFRHRLPLSFGAGVADSDGLSGMRGSFGSYRRSSRASVGGFGAGGATASRSLEHATIINTIAVRRIPETVDPFAHHSQRDVLQRSQRNSQRDLESQSRLGERRQRHAR